MRQFVWLDAIMKKRFFKSVSKMTKQDAPRVLLLDDDAMLRQLMVKLLTQSGFSVTAVATSAEFVRALDNLGADVCVLDWRLAGESGLVLA